MVHNLVVIKPAELWNYGHSLPRSRFQESRITLLPDSS